MFKTLSVPGRLLQVFFFSKVDICVNLLMVPLYLFPPHSCHSSHSTMSRRTPEIDKRSQFDIFFTVLILHLTPFHVTYLLTAGIVCAVYVACNMDCNLLRLPTEFQLLIINELLQDDIQAEGEGYPFKVYHDLINWSCRCSDYRSLLAPDAFKTCKLVNQEKSGSSLNAVTNTPHQFYVKNCTSSAPLPAILMVNTLCPRTLGRSFPAELTHFYYITCSGFPTSQN